MNYSGFDVVFGLIGLAIIVGVVSRGGMLEAFFNMIDLSDNLRLARNWVRKQDGVPALILAVAMAILAYGCWELAYRFDILPTYQYSRWVAAFIVEGEISRERVAFVSLVITLMPTLIEMAAVSLGRDGLKMVTILVFIFAGIDIITDYPAASALVEGWMSQGLFNGWWGWAAFIAEYSMKAGWTILASFGFEMLLVVFSASSIMLLLVSLPGIKGGGRNRRVYEM